MCKRSPMFPMDMVGHMESQNAWTVGKKPRIYDCYGVLEKVAWIWRLLALFPFTIKYPMGIKKYATNSILVVYSLLISAACFTNVVIGLLYYQERLSPSRITMTIATILIRSLSCLLCMFVSSIGRSFSHKQLTESMESIADQEAFLEKIGCRFNHERKAKIIVSYVLTTLFIVLLLMTYDMFVSEHAAIGWFVILKWLRWLLWVTPMVAQVMNLTIFVSLVGLLGFEFRALNEKIRMIVIRANACSPKVIVTSDVCAENLRLAAKAHYNICTVGKRINRFFTLDLIINVVTAFVILSSTLYYIFVEVQKQGKTDTYRIGTYIHWELIHSIPIIIIVVVCNWTTNQSTYAGKFIHEIRVEKTDSRLYEALKSFSLQLHHQKVEFTGGGLFPLNSTLLQTMVGNITTYLVILIQFHPALDY